MLLFSKSLIKKLNQIKIQSNINYDSNNFYLRHRQGGKSGLDNPAFMDDQNRGYSKILKIQYLQFLTLISNLIFNFNF
jgi:hypothetical protein